MHFPVVHFRSFILDIIAPAFSGTPVDSSEIGYHMIDTKLFFLAVTDGIPFTMMVMMTTTTTPASASDLSYHDYTLSHGKQRFVNLLPLF